MTNTVELNLQVNGAAMQVRTEARTHLADVLREELLLTGTHLGCEQGVCGACTLFVDGRPTRACITLASACEGADVRTVEGFVEDVLMERIRDAFTHHHGLQCGFCTPGMLATAYDIVRRLPDADADRIRRELSGNLCRCTGYAGIVAAIESVLQDNVPHASLQPMPRQMAESLSSPNPVPAAAVEGVQSAPTTVRMSESLEVPADLKDAVVLQRSLKVDASPDTVWTLLCEPGQVVPCVPGARLTGAVVDDLIPIALQVNIGPVSAVFSGDARMKLQHEQRSGQVLGHAQDALSRSSLDAALDFELIDENAATSTLQLSMRYRLSGPLAQFGRPAVVEAVADSLLAQTAQALATRANSGASVDHEQTAKALSFTSLLMGMVRGLLARITGKR